MFGFMSKTRQKLFVFFVVSTRKIVRFTNALSNYNNNPLFELFTSRKPYLSINNEYFFHKVRHRFRHIAFTISLDIMLICGFTLNRRKVWDKWRIINLLLTLIPNAFAKCTFMSPLKSFGQVSYNVPFPTTFQSEMIVILSVVSSLTENNEDDGIPNEPTRLYYPDIACGVNFSICIDPLYVCAMW